VGASQGADSYAKKNGKLRGQIRSIPITALQRQPGRSMVSDILEGTFRFMEDHAQKWAPLRPRNLSGRNSRRRRFWMAHSAMASFSQGGRATR